MKELHLFTDGSVDTKSKIGYGAYLLVAEAGFTLDGLNKQVKVRRFEQTSSTRLELQTLLWALDEVKTEGCRLTVYSDSQNIINLPGRRKRLEANDFRSKQNRQLKYHQLYRDFYCLTDQLNCLFVKVRGHQAAKQENFADRLFPLVDRAARKALREDKKLTAQPAKDK
ncbi:Ribonuclease HI [Malonomonas rubra DSM 5091]|uniref:Ribonuclease HI n=1 Tax=Malonomonas rubra DSM 5091 TaxID=1122189 RepID=A0A1M6LWY6_MALRU|nr:RNase H family protein [Malonomonas rubra]SHJ75681.1 Ribonuclease HI [Malonomonas rubra DSM 5091]